MRIALVVALLAVALIVPERSAGIDVVECNGPQANNPNPDATSFEVREYQPLQPVLGLNCLPSGATVSSSPVDWGDGTTSPAKVSYVTNSDGTRQAWIGGDHSYPRATCPTGFCNTRYRVSATVTDDQTGEVFFLRQYAIVTPTIDVIALEPVRARAHKVFRGPLAHVHTGGLRFLGEMTARIDWGDGRRSTARVTGAGQDFAITAVHHWRASGVYDIALVVRDGFTRERTLRYLRGRVTR
ncbi:MAG TPA: hypothetical protein VH247_06985 [Thermoleophilaceae bacterium]|nr:hypothetical protein [Thermoleophilaceae bacterium]